MLVVNTESPAQFCGAQGPAGPSKEECEAIELAIRRNKNHGIKRRHRWAKSRERVHWEKQNLQSGSREGDEWFTRDTGSGSDYLSYFNPNYSALRVVRDLLEGQSERDSSTDVWIRYKDVPRIADTWVSTRSFSSHQNAHYYRNHFYFNGTKWTHIYRTLDERSLPPGHVPKLGDVYVINHPLQSNNHPAIYCYMDAPDKGPSWCEFLPHVHYLSPDHPHSHFVIRCSVTGLVWRYSHKYRGYYQTALIRFRPLTHKSKAPVLDGMQVLALIQADIASDLQKAKTTTAV